MKRMGFVLVVGGIALALTCSALAQNAGDTSNYFVTYYSNNVSGAPDGTVRLINDGDSGSTLWADFYVFDDSEELSECCSCPITADGVLSESVQKELMANPLSGPVRTRGVIKVIGDSAGNPYNPTLAAGLHGWATHVQKATSGYVTTESPLADSNLGPDELYGWTMPYICQILIELGSGYGACSCTPEDQDF
jgi:hypothetical protein